MLITQQDFTPGFYTNILNLLHSKRSQPYRGNTFEIVLKITLRLGKLSSGPVHTERQRLRQGKLF